MVNYSVESNKTLCFQKEPCLDLIFFFFLVLNLTIIFIPNFETAQNLPDIFIQPFSFDYFKKA